MGRTPIIGSVIREFLPWRHMMTYIEAIMRVYNQFGRRDNIYKARIKILVKAIGVAEFTRRVEDEWADLMDGPGTLSVAERNRVSSFFTGPSYGSPPPGDAGLDLHRTRTPAFAHWLKRNVKPHRVRGYAAVVLSLKKPGVPPGDASAAQMDFVADLADQYSFSELRVTHEQNLVLADVREADLFAVWQAAHLHGLATPNIGLLTDIICCPGGDFCSLANAKSIPIALDITQRFDNLDFLHDVGEIEINMSGCVNACGHHHVGNIGILGVDKNGEEWYQVSLGGAQGNDTRLGKVIGPSFSAGQMPEVVARLIQVYLRERIEDERFIDTVIRLGPAPFKAFLYESPIDDVHLVTQQPIEEHAYG